MLKSNQTKRENEENRGPQAETTQRSKTWPRVLAIVMNGRESQVDHTYVLITPRMTSRQRGHW